MVRARRPFHFTKMFSWKHFQGQFRRKRIFKKHHPNCLSHRVPFYSIASDELYLARVTSSLAEENDCVSKENLVTIQVVCIYIALCLRHDKTVTVGIILLMYCSLYRGLPAFSLAMIVQ